MYVIVGNKSYNLTDAEFFPTGDDMEPLLLGHDPHDRLVLVKGVEAEELWAAIVAQADVKVGRGSE